MNVLGVGPLELVVILIVALVFVGPERLPRLAADLARTIREIRKYTGSLAAEFTEIIEDFDKETEGDRSEWKQIGEGLTGATKSVTDALRGVKDDLQGQPPAPATADAPAPAPSSDGAATPGEGAWRDIPEPASPLLVNQENPFEPASAEGTGPASNGATPATPEHAEEAR